MTLWTGPLQVQVAPDEVWRALGYRAGSVPSRRVADLLASLWPRAISLLQPRGGLRLVDLEQANGTGMPAPSAPTALAVCTIGGELEEACAGSQAAGETLHALLLDSIGSAAAEAAADALNALVCDEASRLGLATEPRESPGYGAWDIACQPRLLELLPAAELGVSLTPGLMMQPRKSVSFGVRLTDRPVQAGGRCARCNLTACRRRRLDPPSTLETV
ncbi:MAG: hypothetical protein MUF10_02005 [Thermoanaerobaculaceae bacterium]|jgi:hypothetical protein|nr:hypothetical protein [Thermoanaerobaculaceae bacterium]